MRTTKHHKDIRGMTKQICSVPSRLNRVKSIISQTGLIKLTLPPPPKKNDSIPFGAHACSRHLLSTLHASSLLIITRTLWGHFSPFYKWKSLCSQMWNDLLAKWTKTRKEMKPWLSEAGEWFPSQYAIWMLYFLKGRGEQRMIKEILDTEMGTNPIVC